MCPQPVQEYFYQNINAPALRTSDDDDLEHWVLPKVRTVNNGIETLRYRVQKSGGANVVSVECIFLI